MRFGGSSVLVAVTLFNGCGGASTPSTPVSPTSATSPSQLSGVCRNYASSVIATTTFTFTGANPTVETEIITSSYSTALNQVVATGTVTSSLGCRAGGSWSTTYRSTADLVDEVSVIPPRTRWASQSGTATYIGPTGPCANRTSEGTVTNSYDREGRLVREDSTGNVSFPSMTWASETTTVYAAWDALGRPTAYTTSSPAWEPGSVSGSISYDDAARTRTIQSDIGRTIVDTFDSDGNPVRSLNVLRTRLGRTTPEFVTTIDTTFVIGATTRICR
jgi:hypothetical protein